MNVSQLRPAAVPGTVVGLDVGGSKVHGVLLSDGVVVRQTRGPVTRGLDGVLDAAEAAVRRLVPDGGPGPDVVGVGVPGVVDPAVGTVAHAVNLGIADPVPLAARLRERLATDVVLENDLDASALGAVHLLGLGPDLAYLAMGTGLAVGLVLDGRLRRGPAGGAGEIGHLQHAPDGPVCACGRRGCLELYASGAAIDAAWPSPDGRPAPLVLFEAAEAGDRAAVEVRDGFADAVAAAVEVVVLTTGVRHVVLGGGVGGVGEPLLDAVRAALTRRAATSTFLVTLGLPGRVVLGPGGAVAPVGAALAACATSATPADVPVDAAPQVPTVTSPATPATAGTTTTGGTPRWRS